MIQTVEIDDGTEKDCKCLRIAGHLEAVAWPLYPRGYRAAPGPLAALDFTQHPHIWMHYVEPGDGILPDDDVLKSTDPRYWSLHDPLRYFPGDLHCEQILLPAQYPNLQLTSKHAEHLWRVNAAGKRHTALYDKNKYIAVGRTMKKMITSEVQMERLIIPDQLLKLDRMDHFQRKTFMKELLDIISGQDNLQLVSLEHLGCRRGEAVRLLQQLACFNSDSLKYLFLWRFVLPTENPMLINYSYVTGGAPTSSTALWFTRSLVQLKSLRLLAMEYAHLADDTGRALFALLPVLKTPHFWLQLICREEHTPGVADPARGAGGRHIPDAPWRRVAVACPDLYLTMAFHRIRDYDNARRFLSPSMPVREVHLELGVDVLEQQRQHSDPDCLARHVAYQYGHSLVTFSLHQWRFTPFPLRRVFKLMPGLVRFYYIGMVEDEVDVKRMLNLIACGVCQNLKEIKIQIQDERSRGEYWRQSVDSLTEQYSEIMKLYDIDFCLQLYKG
ncbi:uncharacterized protein LOC105382709 [Plutella xylostella]|uniref:uncharacterized protein LOC105382709 n=1 Tax=Plutella xylostella TaxID=51655 RepID=UPI0020324DCC|nr:uncharacterized protein LOC105382709 [Plutella xylostella]